MSNLQKKSRHDKEDDDRLHQIPLDVIEDHQEEPITRSSSMIIHRTCTERVKDAFSSPTTFQKLLVGVLTAIFIIVIVILGAFAYTRHESAASVEDASDPQTRTYYIASEEVLWNYTSDGEINHSSGLPFDDPMELMMVTNSNNTIGKTYIKAVYKEYTDETFTILKERAPEWTHLGILGPVIQASVGDSIVVVFKNNAGFPYSIHAHGVFYKKESEGAAYNNSTVGIVQPGETYTYHWEVPERAGPAANDPSSILWLYHSHNN